MWAWAETAGDGWRRGTRFLPGEESCKEASRRTGLDTITNNLRLKLERRHASFRAKEKPQASRKNKLVCFSVFPAVFCWAHAHSRASFAGLPRSGGLRNPSNCGKLLVIEVMQYPPLAGSGVQLAPRWGMGQSPIVLPVKFLFLCILLIGYQYK